MNTDKPNNVKAMKSLKLKETEDVVQLFNSASLNVHQTFEDKLFGILTVTGIGEWGFNAHNADSNESFHINSDGDFFSIAPTRSQRQNVI